MFFYLSSKPYVVGTQRQGISEEYPNTCFYREIRKISTLLILKHVLSGDILPVAVAVFPLGLAHLFTLGILGPVVQSFVSLKSLLMTNLLTVVAKVFSSTLIFFSAKM